MASRTPTLALVAVLGTVALAGCISTGQPTDLSRASLPGGFSLKQVFEGTYDLTGNFSRTLQNGPFEILPGVVEVLDSALDGGRIEVGIIRPDVPEGTKVPIIVQASPYYRALETLDMQQRMARYVENFVPHGYAVVLLPVRGTANHGGCFDFMGDKERADLDQAITWLGEQAWSNGRVGMIGGSYDGSTPWEVAGEGNPYLKTIVPISGVNDLYHLMYKNGSREVRSSGTGMTYGYYTYGWLLNSPLNGRDLGLTVEGAACPEMWEGLASAEHSFLTGERNAWWEERNSRPRVEQNYEGSVFLVQGLQDWNVDPSHSYPWVNALAGKGLVVKHLLGQWSHMAPDSRPGDNPHVRWDWAEILLRWFDYWLKDDRTVDLGPLVQVEDSESNWRSEESWPPGDAVRRAFYLGPERTLAEEPAAGEERVLITPDPNDRTFLGTHRAPVFPPVGATPYSFLPCGCAAFATEAFEEEVRFAGLPPVHLTVVPQGPGGHLSAWLYVQGGASTVRAGWTQMDLRFADGGEEPREVTPGEPLVARLEMEPLDVVIPAGSRLLLVVGTTPYGDRSGMPTAPFEVVVGGEASTLYLDTFQRGHADLFEPPGT